MSFLTSLANDYERNVAASNGLREIVGLVSKRLSGGVPPRAASRRHPAVTSARAELSLDGLSRFDNAGLWAFDAR